MKPKHPLTLFTIYIIVMVLVDFIERIPI